jgi:hypothetical protein
VIIGVVLASAFSAILVYAQELMPGNVGMISGLFFGFAFGMGGLGAAVLGQAGGCNQHRARVPPMRLSSRNRTAYGLPSGSEAPRQSLA